MRSLRPDIRRYGDYWLWVGGPVPPGSAAITIWTVVVVRAHLADNPILLCHEEVHVRQWREMGPAGFLGAYLGSYVASRWRGFGHQAAYRLIPAEIEAAEAAAALRRATQAGQTVERRSDLS